MECFHYMWLIFVFSFSLPSLSCIIGCGQIQIAVVAATKYPTPSAGGRKFNNLVFFIVVAVITTNFRYLAYKKIQFFILFSAFSLSIFTEQPLAFMYSIFFGCTFEWWILFEKQIIEIRFMLYHPIVPHEAQFLLNQYGIDSKLYNIHTAHTSTHTIEISHINLIL